ncbi:hypothetical protein [Chromobacterium haemolyticum]|uniref:hypothetical protein n=1 Tax=Chromobacterium haemolyticum TaxID=394935 RepID=UPI0012F9328C|nr:hypothetical protein [Chromobacterium haemolyticum]
MKITGRWSFRKTWLGKLVLQVEVAESKISRHDRYRMQWIFKWRDATPEECVSLVRINGVMRDEFMQEPPFYPTPKTTAQANVNKLPTGPRPPAPPPPLNKPHLTQRIVVETWAGPVIK